MNHIFSEAKSNVHEKIAVLELLTKSKETALNLDKKINKVIKSCNKDKSNYQIIREQLTNRD
jgi:hypothetical protein